MAETIRAQNIAAYKFTSSDHLLLDANVWLFVYGPQKPGDYRAAVYSQALLSILAAKSHIYIDVLVVSEFINTYARTQFYMTEVGGEFKQFRKSAAFKPVAQDIAAAVKRVLQHCTRVTNRFESQSIDGMLNEYAMGDSDFNDQVLLNLCKDANWMLVTDDGDFRNRGVAVITANRRLL